ncbi:MAG: radical SAM protein, partial [Myxococcota bacterium]|nr:radical SAM protein [Myxococcota bacterium]
LTRLHPRHVRPPFALKITQALLPGTRLLDGEATGWGPPALIDASRGAELVAVQATTTEREVALGIGRSLAGQVGRRIAVGQDPSACPGIYLQGGAFDGVIRGEPELALLELATGTPRPEGYQSEPDEPATRRLVEDPDVLPWPRFTLEELHRYRFLYPVSGASRPTWGHLLAGRGCPGLCTFCTGVTRESVGRRARLRDPIDVAEEAASQVLTGATVLSLDDDDLSQDRNHALAVAEALHARVTGVPWIAHARVDEMDEELARTWQRCGCRLVRMGVESGSPRVAALLGKVRDGECEQWPSRVQRAFDACRRADLPTAALFIVGTPGETPGDRDRTTSLAASIRPDFVQVHHFAAYPGSGWAARHGVRDAAYHYAPSGHEPEVQRAAARAIWRAAVLRPRPLAQHALRYGRCYLHDPALVGTAARLLFSAA